MPAMCQEWVLFLFCRFIGEISSVPHHAFVWYVGICSCVNEMGGD